MDIPKQKGHRNWHVANLPGALQPTDGQVAAARSVLFGEPRTECERFPVLQYRFGMEENVLADRKGGVTFFFFEWEQKQTKRVTRLNYRGEQPLKPRADETLLADEITLIVPDDALANPTLRHGLKIPVPVLMGKGEALARLCH